MNHGAGDERRSAFILPPSPLSLLVFRLALADDVHNALAFHDLAVGAALLNRRANFHLGSFSVRSDRRSQTYLNR